MAKEWLLNSATNRFQLNFKRNVGATSESIRLCAPKSLSEWQSYYFANVRSERHIEGLGQKLFVKITEVLCAEMQEITENDCIEYMKNLVINRTYDGYTTEIETIYGQLGIALNVKIEPASDEWDRLYNVDFFIKVDEKFVGLQVKPVSDVSHIPEIFKEKGLQEKSHLKFQKEFGGRVFYIYSLSKDRKKLIANPEVIEEIKNELVALHSI